MINPYDNEDVRQLNFKLGHIGEQSVRKEINRFDGYSTVKAEFTCPDYKIFIGGELAGFAEVKVQKMRYLLSGNRALGYSFKSATIDNYRKFNTPQTPLEFYVVDPVAKTVFWDFFSELEREREIDGAIFPFDQYAKLFDGEAHHWHISQFRYRFPISDTDADALRDTIEARDKIISGIQDKRVDELRERRMNAYDNYPPF